MPYETQPGTVPHRVVMWLRAQAKATMDPDAEYSSFEICEALGLDPLIGFASSMRAVRDHGLVHTRPVMTDVKRLMWSLGDGTPDPGTYKRKSPKAVKHRAPPVTIPAPPPSFRALALEGCFFVTGMEIRDGVAIFTPEQILTLRRQVDRAMTA